MELYDKISNYFVSNEDTFIIFDLLVISNILGTLISTYMIQKIFINDKFLNIFISGILSSIFYIKFSKYLNSQIIRMYIVKIFIIIFYHSIISFWTNNIILYSIILSSLILIGIPSTLILVGIINIILFFL